MKIFPIIEIIALSSTIMMTGIIWFVQLVHYPLFKEIPVNAFVNYEQKHTAKTGYLVAPLMLLELMSNIWIWYNFPGWEDHWAMILLLIIWLSTFLIQVPLHRKLSQGYDVKSINRLIRSNWIRTICWTARAGLMLRSVFYMDYAHF